MRLSSTAVCVSLVVTDDADGALATAEAIRLSSGVTLRELTAAATPVSSGPPSLRTAEAAWLVTDSVEELSLPASTSVTAPIANRLSRAANRTLRLVPRRGVELTVGTVFETDILSLR